jgi:hypothetical protein
VKGVAAFLGNPPRCAAAHISIQASSIARDGATIAAALRRAGSLDEVYLPSAQRHIERAVMRLLSG